MCLNVSNFSLNICYLIHLCLNGRNVAEDPSTTFSFKERKNSVVQKLSALPAVVKRGLSDPVTRKARPKATTDPADPRNSLPGSLWRTNKEIYFIRSLFRLSRVFVYFFPEDSPYCLENHGTEHAAGCKNIINIATVARRVTLAEWST